MDELKAAINIFNNNISKIINKLNKVMNNIDIYYKINDEILKNYDFKYKNYQTLKNINEINNNIIEEIMTINKDNNIYNQFKSIINIYDKMITKDSIENTSNKNNEEKNIKIILEEKDIEIAKNINEFLKIISSYNNNKNLKINLEKYLFDYEQNKIEKIILKIKTEELKNNPIILNQNDKFDYSIEIITKVFNIIVPTFCQDIICSILFSNINKKFSQMKDIVLDIYKQTNISNYKTFFNNMKQRKNIIYTFSKDTNILLNEGKPFENRFGVFNNQDFINERNENIKSENDLISALNSNNNKIIIINFSENEINKIDSIISTITIQQNANKKLKEKIIIFIIHIERNIKNQKSKEIAIPTFIDNGYFHLFIDNLNGKGYLNLLKILEKEEKEFVEEYIINMKFIENNIMTVISFIDFNVFFETKDLNKGNYSKKFSEKIINNQSIKDEINDLLKKEWRMHVIINKIFTNDIILKNNNVEFFEIIFSQIRDSFLLLLLQIIIQNYIILQTINGPYLDILIKKDYFKDLKLLNSISNKKIKMEINKNKVDICNYEIAKSRNSFTQIKNYIIREIYHRYLNNENLLRINYSTNEKSNEIIQIYIKNINRFVKNVKNEMDKNTFFMDIYNEKNVLLSNILIDDYLKFFIIECMEDKSDYCKTNGCLLLNFLKKILNAKFRYQFEFNCHNNNSDCCLKKELKKLINIILFTQIYVNDIKNIFEIYKEVQKFCKSIDEELIKILDKNIIKFEISKRNKKYKKIVNDAFFKIIES